MKQRFKFFLFSFVILFILFVLGAANVEKKDTSPFIQSIKSILPLNIKILLRKTVFSIPVLNRVTDRHKTVIGELSLKVEELSKKVELIDGPELLASEPYSIKSKSNVYNIRTFYIPFIHKYSYHERMKAAAYLEQTNDEIVMASGSGEFFHLKKKDIGLDNLYLKRIKSNIKKLIKDEKFYSNRLDGIPGIRDLLLLDNNIFFSFIKEQTDDCYNTSIMIAEFNSNYLNFSEFFSYKECINTNIISKFGKSFVLALFHSGGRMVSFKNEKILFTTGDMSHKLLAQDKNSMFGKIISIDLQSKDYEIISMGSRNAQGLYYDENRNITIHTEHGPEGGDEININFNLDNKIIENYGWPISSYGELSGKFMKEAPAHKSHKAYGFIEPIKYYTPSIAISEIVRIPITFNEKFTNDFFVGALGRKNQIDEGDRSIHHIRFNESFNQIIFNDVIPIGERIRDMIYIKEKKMVLMVLESIPAIAFLTLAN